VVNGAESAPTILDGPGLATAGNIDPSAPDTVGGLVPGINTLRQDYNVVTWDPRGEFDSDGTLQLDNPDFEGQDVVGIINWLSANTEYSHQAFDDGIVNEPADGYTTANDTAIGMVGGSDGGGIQLASAYVDPRVDVIVPGIAWNSLTDSLYPDQAVKTSYASLLLLGLVTTGSRINPQIYAGIITGDLLGILTPGQQALLNASGPYYFVDDMQDIHALYPRHRRCVVPAGPRAHQRRQHRNSAGRRQDDLVLRRSRPVSDPYA
jgi:ABC-2 type transport system ATP-binding protein